MAFPFFKGTNCLILLDGAAFTVVIVSGFNARSLCFVFDELTYLHFTWKLDHKDFKERSVCRILSIFFIFMPIIYFLQLIKWWNLILFWRIIVHFTFSFSCSLYLWNYLIVLAISLVEKVKKTVQGSANDIGWLQRDPNMPPVEDGTERFTEILDNIRFIRCVFFQHISLDVFLVYVCDFDLMVFLYQAWIAWVAKHNGLLVCPR